jgi:hypothetical protein
MDQKTEACSRKTGTSNQYTHMHACTLVCHFKACALSKVDNLRNTISSTNYVHATMHTVGTQKFA